MLGRVVAVLTDGDLGNRRLEQVAAPVLDGHPWLARPQMTADVGGKPGDVDGGEIRVPCRGHVGEEGPAFPAPRAEGPAVTARGDVAPPTRVRPLGVPRRGPLLVLHEHAARPG